MCNLYSITKGQAAIRESTRATVDHSGNLPPLPGVFPDYAAPIVRMVAGARADDGALGHALAAVRLQGRSVDPGVTNIRDTKNPHGRQ